MIHLRTLGGLELNGGEPREMRAILTQPKRLALLVYLAVATPRGYHRRDTILGLFWPEKDTEHARNSLRQSIHALRQSLGADILLSRGDQDLGLDWSRFSCDTDAFQSALEARNSEDALDIYRGHFLPGFYVESTQFESWLDAQRSRLRHMALREAGMLTDRATASGDLSLAIQCARRVCSLSDDDESAAMRLISLHGRVGDRMEARRVYDSFSRRLSRELGLAPSFEMEALIDRIVSADRGTLQSAWSLAPEDRSPDVARLEGERHRYDLASTVTGTRVAVLPFIVRAEPRLRFLREGVAEMLGTALDGSANLHVVDSGAVRSFCGADDDPDIDTGRAVAHRFGGHAFILGTVVGTAGKIRLLATLNNADGTVRTSVGTETGREEQIFGLVDELGRKLLAAEYPGPAGRRMRSATETTASLPALKHYLQGEREFVTGKWINARDAFSLALKHDPALALAWERLGWIWCWLLQGDEARKCLTRAHQHAARLSEHDAIGLDAFRAFLSGDANTAEKQYRDLLARWPDDIQAHVGLGMTRVILNPLRGRSPDEAADPMRRARILDPGNLDARLVLAYLGARRSQYDELDSLHQWLPPDSDYGMMVAVDHALAHHDEERLSTLANGLERAPEVVVHECSRYAAVIGHDLGQARRFAGILTHSSRGPQARATGHTLLAQIQIVNGSIRASRKEFQAAQSFARVQAGVYRALAAVLPFVSTPRTEIENIRRELASWDLDTDNPVDEPPFPFVVHNRVYPQLREYLLCLLCLRAGARRAAAGHSRKLASLSGPQEADALAFDLCLSLEAHIEEMDGNHGAALAALEQSRLQPPFERVQMQSPFFSENLERFLRAELLEKTGRLDEALRWYDTLCENGVHEFAYLAPSHFRRGEIRERLGERDLAIDHFRKVTTFWHECDRELRPKVAKAEQALARLRAE